MQDPSPGGPVDPQWPRLPFIRRCSRRKGQPRFSACTARPSFRSGVPGSQAAPPPGTGQSRAGRRPLGGVKGLASLPAETGAGQGQSAAPRVESGEGSAGEGSRSCSRGGSLWAQAGPAGLCLLGTADL